MGLGLALALGVLFVAGLIGYAALQANKPKRALSPELVAALGKAKFEQLDDALSWCRDVADDRPSHFYDAAPSGDGREGHRLWANLFSVEMDQIKLRPELEALGELELRARPPGTTPAGDPQHALPSVDGDAVPGLALEGQVGLREGDEHVYRPLGANELAFAQRVLEGAAPGLTGLPGAQLTIELGEIDEPVQLEVRWGGPDSPANFERALGVLELVAARLF